MIKPPAAPLPVTPSSLHVGIIMDGNGRWATRQGRSRAAGHRQGAKVVRRIAEVAPDLGVGMLTVFAFSADNWQRPDREVNWLMRLFREYLRTEAMRCAATGVRLTVLGRRDRLSKGLLEAVQIAESTTAGGHRLHLRIAIDYSARDAILRAAQCLSADTVPSRESFGRLLSIVDHGGPAAQPVDLLIRTGGERRLSDFLLWECAYAELCFMPIMWPDFGPEHLAEAVADFRHRERRFGALPDAAAAS
ncbi:MAG TPA: di-trans,poly-cis-decaprenylcistransferase [Gemmatimonadales bacterium]|nr:di-trans,poly-cis-decaprenylcistransferase [Gemmatimonadales bacterium]